MDTTEPATATTTGHQPHGKAATGRPARTDLERIGALIQTRRTLRGLTRPQVTAIMNAHGHHWTSNTIHVIENGTQRLLMGEANDLARLLGLDPDELTLPAPDTAPFQTEQALDDMDNALDLLRDDLDRYQAARAEASRLHATDTTPRRIHAADDRLLDLIEATLRHLRSH